MTSKRHTEEQIIALVMDAQAGVVVHELCGSIIFRMPRPISGGRIRGRRSERCDEAAPIGSGKPVIETDGGGASAGHPAVARTPDSRRRP